MFNKREGRRFAAFVRFAVAALAALLAASEAAVAQSARDAEMLKEILHAYEKREEQLNPVWVRYHLTHWESVAWRNATTRNEPPEERRWTSKGEYALKGVKTRNWADAGPPSPYDEGAGERFYIYTGEVQISKTAREDVYAFKKQPERIFVAETPFQIAGEDLLLADANWPAGNPGAFSITSAGGDQGAVVLEWRYPTGPRTKYWLLPEKGWALQRREAYDDKNGPMNFSEVKEFGVCNGIPYPKRGRHDNYLATNELGKTVEFEVDAIETRAAHIPDSLFQFDIPKTANVYDADLKVTVRNTELAESHLKEVVARAAGRSDWTWWLWTSAGVVVLGFAALAGWLYRQRKRAGTKTANGVKPS